MNISYSFVEFDKTFERLTIEEANVLIETKEAEYYYCGGNMTYPRKEKLEKKTEHLTTLDVINLIREKRATIQDYGEGVGKLLTYQNEIYYQSGDKFYLNEREIKKWKTQ